MIGNTKSILIAGVSVPLLHPINRYHVLIKNGKVVSVASCNQNCSIINQDSSQHFLDCHNLTVELWPGFVENHAHLALPTNIEKIREHAETIKLQYLYFGITHVIDLFGYPEIDHEWSTDPSIASRVAHCGYALTSPNEENKIGHGSEYPVPIHIVDTEEKIISAIDKNIALGATFLKVMYSSGIEKLGDIQRFSLLKRSVLNKINQIAKDRELECVIDCNTLAEVKVAVECGYRYFAHSIRDKVLNDEDWRGMRDCYFMTTLQGLKPMIMTGQEMLSSYQSSHFHRTQLPGQEKFFSSVNESYGTIHGMQSSRLSALDCMYQNSVSALNRKQCLIGSDSGNTLAYHGFSYYQELQGLLAEKKIERKLLLETATEKARHFFYKLRKQPMQSFLKPGTDAAFNLIAVNKILPSHIIYGSQFLTPEIVSNQILTSRQKHNGDHL